MTSSITEGNLDGIAEGNNEHLEEREKRTLRLFEVYLQIHMLKIKSLFPNCEFFMFDPSEDSIYVNSKMQLRTYNSL